MTLLARPTADELDPWLRYTKWHDVLSQSKHDIVKTHKFVQDAEPEETQLEHLARAWDIVMQRCLDTLEHTDHKDTLKWWNSPKNEVANQFPFELHQNAQSVDRCRDVWRNFLFYMVRTVPERPHGETGKLI